MRTPSRGVVMCAGANQAATWSGSVQARNTASRGASKMRVIRTSWPAVASLMGLSFLAQMRIESVHPGLPRPLPRLHPPDRVVEGIGLEPAPPPLRLARAGDQPGPLEHL